MSGECLSSGAGEQAARGPGEPLEPDLLTAHDSRRQRPAVWRRREPLPAVRNRAASAPASAADRSRPRQAPVRLAGWSARVPPRLTH